jgi:hypothetical protein
LFNDELVFQVATTDASRCIPLTPAMRAARKHRENMQLVYMYVAAGTAVGLASMLMWRTLKLHH